MITRADIVERVREWQLTEEVIEKDYVLGWPLWGFGSDPILGDQWVFKGGTCLKKCYIETHRFSEDLDFTVLPRGPCRPEQIEPLLGRVLARVHDASGIDFSFKPPALRLRPDELSTEGRVYYIGPRQTPQAACVKLDISANESVVRPPVLRDIAHPYPDGPLPGRVRCYSFEEVFAEKIRAMAQRARPRDLYDIVNLFRRNDLRLYPELIRQALEEKCAAKNIAMPTAADFVDTPLIAALEGDWPQMLAHQLPALPPLQDFLDELPLLFGWLDGTVEFEDLPPLPRGVDEDAWSPPRPPSPPGAPAYRLRRFASPPPTISALSSTMTAAGDSSSPIRSDAAALGGSSCTPNAPTAAGIAPTESTRSPGYASRPPPSVPATQSSSPPRDRSTPRPRVGPRAAWEWDCDVARRALDRRHLRTSTNAPDATRSSATADETPSCAPTRTVTATHALDDTGSISRPASATTNPA